MKQAREDPAAYEARIQAVLEVKRRHELFRRTFDAENYHLGQAKALGYVSAELIQLIFGGEIIKGATKGITKGAQFIKRVQQGAGVGDSVAEGVKVAEGVAKIDLLNKEKQFKTAYEIAKSGGKHAGMYRRAYN